MKAKHVGLLVGVIAGIVWMWLGFGALLLCAVLGALGYLVGATLAGDIDLERFIDNLRRK